ncbi:PTS mannitol transporter subunit IICBA [Effusibacillus consociatus]|uniref:Mannitol-specific phosphotransferase enzyme IIA component n=1 Tax=Effusibacillus consociatus TaxID=1117041 RepID=A0ABV9PXJ6_9BACL
MNKVGRLLSAIVFQNIAALIAVGIIRSLFGVYGWWPDDRIYLLVDPMLNILIPVLLGYTGGRLLGGQRGAVVASVVTLGLVLASSVPMIIGAMIVGPLTGWLMGRLDKTLENRLPVGFELMVANLLAAVLAVVLTVVCFTYVGQTLSAGIKWLNTLMEEVIHSGWLPLAAVFIEPGKVLFFNNVMNHGILGPLGIQQAKDLGKSIFFLLESNPGPGLGMLLAYLLKTRGEQRKAVKVSIVIHSLGGIHEVYFPYVLMNPVLFLSVIAGGITGVAVFQHLDAGVVATPSPGSIFFLIALAPRDDILAVLCGVILSAAVSFVTAFFMLKSTSESPSTNMKLEELAELEGLQHVEKWESSHPVVAASMETKEKTAESDIALNAAQRRIRTIVFACDAGMASSAMGAALLKKRLKLADLAIVVKNSSVDDIPKDADLIVTHKNLTSRALRNAPEREHVSIDSFTDVAFYDNLIERLKGTATASSHSVLSENQVLLGCRAASREKAIEIVGRHMVKLGFVKLEYIEEMLQRERLLSTYIGNGVAVPHGLESGASILKPDIVIAQFPEGVPFNGETAYLVIGIAGHQEHQVQVLSSIADIVEDRETMRRLSQTDSKNDFLLSFQPQDSNPGAN